PRSWSALPGRESAGERTVRASWRKIVAPESDLSGVRDLPADDGRDHFPRQLPSIERCVPRLRARLGDVVGPLLLRIENSNVGDGPADQRTPAAKIETASRAGSEQFHNAGKRDTLFAMQPRDRQRQGSFEAGNAERGALEFHLLFVGGVRSMIGGD